jgi:hypothetical protein
MRQRPAVIVMIKAPRAREAKTRLTPILSAAEAASLAACFALDAVACAKRAARDVIAAYTPADARQALESLLPHDLLWMEQRGDHLGVRLEGALAQAAALGFSPLIVTGTDSPTLPHALIETALDALSTDAADLVLGPTEDGGYYLLGLRQPARNIFQNVAWSTSLVYRQTAANALRLGLRLCELLPWYDVDTPTDLSRLRDELHADQGARERAAATYRWLLAHEQATAPPL